MRVVTDGLYAISDDFDIPGEGTSEFVFANGWLLEIVHVKTGDYWFFSDGEPVRPTGKRFGVFYPPFTFVRAFARKVSGRTLGVGSETLPSGLPISPFIFETKYAGELKSVDDVREVLDASLNRQSIEVNTRPSPVSRKTKRLIDDNYLIYPSIARIAERLKVSHEHLSRQFKKDYGLTPSAYLHKLRVAEATFRLSKGEEIIDISLDVGYNDLSRFYKQFRKATRTSPAVCRKQVLR